MKPHLTTLLATQSCTPHTCAGVGSCFGRPGPRLAGAGATSTSSISSPSSAEEASALPGAAALKERGRPTGRLADGGRPRGRLAEDGTGEGLREAPPADAGPVCWRGRWAEGGRPRPRLAGAAASSSSSLSCTNTGSQCHETKARGMVISRRLNGTQQLSKGCEMVVPNH